MDPLGFSLDNFDAVGQWRSKEAGQPIDASGQLADGTIRGAEQHSDFRRGEGDGVICGDDGARGFAGVRK